MLHIQWQAETLPLDADGFEVRRKGDTNVIATIVLWVNHDPPHYKLSPALASLLDLHTAARPSILLALWKYIKVRHA